MSTIADLVARARQYSKEAGISLATLATRAVNDGKLFDRLKDGKSITFATAEKLSQYMATHPPAEERKRRPAGSEAA